MCPCDIASEETLLYEIGHKKLKYSGPQQLLQSAQFMNVDSDLWVFRRFGKLHLFNVLRIQQHLIRLERELEKEVEDDKPGISLLPEIQRTLREYDDALLAQARFKAYREPESHVLKHMRDKAPQHAIALKKALDSCPREEEEETLQDLASVAAVEKSWTHRYIDRHGFLHKRLAKKSQAVENLYSTLTYSEESVRRAEAVFLHASFCLLLLGPVAALLYVPSTVWKLVVLGVSILAASLLSVGFLDALNKTSLALVAGYAAILVVFLSNNVRT